VNFDPNIPTNLAVLMGLLAAGMWGTWFISLKYLGNYPLEAFYLTLFATSMLLVWGLGLILDGNGLILNLKEVWQADKSRIIVTFICGVLYVAGILLSLWVFKVIGLSVSQPLQASINLIIGTLLSALIGGVPAGMTIGRIVSSGVFLLIAIILTMKAGSLRNQAQAEKQIDTGLSRDPKAIRQAVLLLIVGSAFVPAYSTGLSYGLKSITQPDGLAVMPFMAVLCTGAFLSALAICSISLTRNKQWSSFKQVDFKIHKFGILSGFAHYGGNIIHTFATRNLSAVVAWPLGITNGLWTQMWGLAFGEFKGSPTKTYFYLAGGILCYLIGAFIISNVI